MSAIDSLFSCCNSRPYLGPPSDFSKNNSTSAAYQAAQDEKKTQSHDVAPVSASAAPIALVTGVGNYLLASLRE